MGYKFQQTNFNNSFNIPKAKVKMRTFRGLPSDNVCPIVGKFVENDWTASASGWTKNQTTATITLTGSSITYTGGSTATTANYAQWNGLISGSCKSEFEIDYNITTKGAGLYLEFKSMFNLGTNANGIRYYLDVSGSKSAVLFVYNGVTAVTTTVLAPAGFVVNNGDTMRMNLSIDNYTVTIKSYTLQNPGVISTTKYTASYAGYPAGVELNNHYKLRVGTFGGTQTLTNWKFILNNQKNPTNLYIVDSLGRGLGCSYKEQAYPFLINKVNGKPFEVIGGPSDRLNLFLPYTTEITTINAKNVFNCMGYNDYRLGDSTTTVVNNATLIKNAVEAQGSNFYQVGMIPNSLVNVRPLNTAFKNAFGTKYIDIYDALKGSGTLMSTNFSVPLDPVPHINDNGHAMIRDILLNYTN